MVRTRKDTPPEAAGPAAGPGRRWLLQAGLPVVAGAALLAALLLGGTQALDRLRHAGRYRAAFADIACAPPAGLARAEFLAEVQYLANLPDRLELLDEGLPQRLSAAFAAHPWVAEVRRVELTPGRQVRVELAYREPVLAVRLPGREEAPCRAVDRDGVLLPVAADCSRLPRLAGEVPAPTAGPGHPWGDAGVLAAARTAAVLLPHRDRLALGEETSVAAGPDGVVVSAPGVRVVWGSPPGAEQDGEPAAAVKLRRLLDQAAPPGGLAGHEYDLRPAAAAARTPLR
jgi:hypothetical protein